MVFAKSTLALLAVLLAGCAAKTADQSQYSGFLKSYSEIKPVTTATGHETLRWIAPDYQANRYTSLYFAPVVYYPRAQPSERVSAATLEQIRSYTESRLKSALAARKKLIDKPQPGSLIVKTAITAVTAENKDMQFYEVVPIAAVVAGTMAATGHRSQNAELFLEAEAIDAATGKPVIKVIRKGYGKTVANGTAPITATDVQSAIDDMVKDVAAFSTQ
ncbi:DUF3313 domain-containing protein [Erwinia sp. CGal63]|uniref:DUF3313 domain-containing protein n=1 Tax=Erwinia sp. CGal63 TaxID=2919889 RepID=UPI0030099581